jgi:hypothetical protein
MNRLRLPLRRLAAPDSPNGERRIIRQFFDLIEKLERPFRKAASMPAPEVKARITRLDDEHSRHV